MYRGARVLAPRPVGDLELIATPARPEQDSALLRRETFESGYVFKEEQHRFVKAALRELGSVAVADSLHEPLLLVVRQGVAIASKEGDVQHLQPV